MEDHDKDDEHYAPESGDREDEDQGAASDDPEPDHDKDDEHYAPES